jgi:homoserine kinase
VAAELVAKHQETPWKALMLAVDFKGATVTPHSVALDLLGAR